MNAVFHALAAVCRRLLGIGRRRADLSTNARIFTDIYRTNAWGHPESRSGPGSTLARGTAVCHALLQVLAELRPHTFLDAPCGDFNWMRHVPLPGIRYVGVDVVMELIERNRRLYAGNVRRFLTLDMTLGPLPRADLVFCRDGLVHLSFADIFKALAQFRASGSRYLLTTTFTGRAHNDDVATGGWRPLNLERAPFNFPPPLRLLSDGCPTPGYTDKMLALWPMDIVPGHRAGA